ncbi:NUDIX domain-containing protein, partial [bacterium]|nr:NUDIX domain-containing protein [bacterium]
TWDLPGGDLDFGEEAIEGLIREVEEETGLKIRNPLPFDVESHINKEGDFWITIAYKAKADSEKVVLSFEHNDFKWLTPEEFLEL